MKCLAIVCAMVLFLTNAHAQEQTIGAITVNGDPISNVELIDMDGDALVFSVKRWKELGVALTNETDDKKRLTSKAIGVEVVFDEARQLYEITIPVGMRFMQKLGHRRIIDTNVGASPKGVMIGYDLSATTARDGKTNASLVHDIRANVASGTLFHSGQINTGEGDTYKRGLTTWSKDLFGSGVRVQAGDVFTTPHNSTLNNTVNMGGVRIGTDRNLSNDVSYPVPLVGGIADTRSTAELLTNSSRLSQSQVEPGPYQFSQLYYPGGLNDITLITRDDSRREYLTTRSFYVRPDMVRKGALEWDVELGKLRQGRTGEDYTTPAVNAQAAYGINDNWTMSASVQATQENKNYTMGNAFSLGNFGGLSVDLAKSDDGNAYSVGYERRHKSFSINASHSEFSENYWQLSDETGSSSFRTKSMTALGVGYATDRLRVSGSYAKAESFDGSSREVISARARYQANTANSFSAYVSHDLEAGDTSLMLGWQHKFGANTRGSLTHQFAPTPQTNATLSGNAHLGSIPVQWNVSSNGDRHFGQAHAQLKKVDIDVRATNDEVRVGVEGGLWVGEGGIIPVKRSHSSFTVVEVPNAANVNVSGSYGKVKANKNGYVVIPNSAPLVATPIRVESQSLALDTQLEENELKAVAPRGGGVKATFVVKTDKMRSYRLIYQDKPIDEVSKAVGTDETVLVGRGGVLVLDKPLEGQVFEVVGKDFTCVATLPNISLDAMETIDVACKKETP